MFRAAITVGVATRPLQVFYGLSQAGRAIAAANTPTMELSGLSVGRSPGVPMRPLMPRSLISQARAIFRSVRPMLSGVRANRLSCA